MPTAPEFDQAASLLDTAADATAALMGPVAAAMGPSVMSGGRLSETTNEFIEAQRIDAVAIAADIAELSDECRRRAEATRDAEAAQLKYERDLAMHNEIKSQFESGEFDGSIFEALRGLAEPVQPTPPPWAEF